MSFAGFKKQLNKANQYMTEKIGGAEGTKLDDDFLEMERKTDVMTELVEDLQSKTREYLQPNPASRAKMLTANTVSKIRGQVQKMPYPQPEGNLGDVMVKYGKELGNNSDFGSALLESGDAFKQLADIKYGLEDNVRQNFLEPLQQLQQKDLKEVNHHRKKLSGRRLDYDCKKRKKEKEGSKMSDDEVRLSEEKFEESWNLAEAAMVNLLENDVEQISQLSALIQAQLDFFRQSAEVLEDLVDKIDDHKESAENRPKRTPSIHKVPRRSVSSTNSDPWTDHADSGSMGAKSGSYTFNADPWDHTNTPPPVYSASSTPAATAQPSSKPCCEALYDFEPENDGELEFSEGDVIELKAQIDENWFEGSIHGKTGFFPINYVKVLTPLPSSQGAFCP